MNPPILLSIQDAVAHITLNRPEQANVLDEATGQTLIKVTHELTQACDRGEVRAVLISARGPHFCAGGDIRGFAASDNIAALLDRSLDLAITAGGFAERLLSRQVLGEGDYQCLVDPVSLAQGQRRLSLEEFVAREHILVSSGGFIGITDEGLAALGLSRRVCASTTHFAALPHLLKGSGAVATIPSHAAQAIAELSGLVLLPCPLALPRYPIELGWRTSTQIDPVVVKVREAIAATFS